MFFIIFRSARIIDLELCFWLKQTLFDEEKIENWIEKHEPSVKFEIDREENDRSIHRKAAMNVLLYASIVPMVEQQMKQANLWNYYLNVEMPALRVILQILLNGILLDRNELTRNRELLSVRR